MRNISHKICVILVQTVVAFVLITEWWWWWW